MPLWSVLVADLLRFYHVFYVFIVSFNSKDTLTYYFDSPHGHIIYNRYNFFSLLISAFIKCVT